MATEAQQETYEILIIQYANINTAISILMGKNKKYTYSNVEGTHMAETHTLTELSSLRKDTREEINALISQCSGSFVKLKNY
jgi:hypothetical protein